MWFLCSPTPTTPEGGEGGEGGGRATFEAGAKKSSPFPSPPFPLFTFSFLHPRSPRGRICGGNGELVGVDNGGVRESVESEVDAHEVVEV